METSLHRQLKEFYCTDARRREVQVDGFRIDAVCDGTLVEIQQASLAALRKKVSALLERHAVIVVKPLAAHKLILKRSRARGSVVTRRSSPKRETLLSVFHELVYFLDVFPHPRLTLEVLLTGQEEVRLPKKSRRWRAKDYRVEDRRLVEIFSRHILRSAADLAALLPEGLPEEFTTADIARQAGIPRWLAQKMTYCLRRVQAVESRGKRGNSGLYSRLRPARRAA